MVSVCVTIAGGNVDAMTSIWMKTPDYRNVRSHLHDEPQLPWLRTAIRTSHRPRCKNGSHPRRITCHAYVTLMSGLKDMYTYIKT